MNDLALMIQKLQGMVHIAVFLHHDPEQAEALASKLYRACREYYWVAAMQLNEGFEDEIPPMLGSKG